MHVLRNGWFFPNCVCPFVYFDGVFQGFCVQRETLKLVAIWLYAGSDFWWTQVLFFSFCWTKHYFSFISSVTEFISFLVFRFLHFWWLGCLNYICFARLVLSSLNWFRLVGKLVWNGVFFLACRLSSYYMKSLRAHLLQE